MRFITFGSIKEGVFQRSVTLPETEGRRRRWRVTDRHLNAHLVYTYRLFDWRIDIITVKSTKTYIVSSRYRSWCQNCICVAGTWSWGPYCRVQNLKRPLCFESQIWKRGTRWAHNHIFRIQTRSLTKPDLEESIDLTLFQSRGWVISGAWRLVLRHICVNGKYLLWVQPAVWPRACARAEAAMSTMSGLRCRSIWPDSRPACHLRCKVAF